MTGVTKLKLDHLVITSPQLDLGVSYISQNLGVTLQPGGEHGSMGTHNALLKLGDSIYLEVIAPNPNSKKPEGPRWFNLDLLKSYSAPRFVTWVVRTNDIYATRAASSKPLGKIIDMKRGDFEWLITIPADGSMTLDGIAPVLIEWKTPGHPTEILPESGCSLMQLEAYHPEPAKIKELFDSIGVPEVISVFPSPAGRQPYLIAYIKTQTGMKKISGQPF